MSNILENIKAGHIQIIANKTREIYWIIYKWILGFQMVSEIFELNTSYNSKLKCFKILKSSVLMDLFPNLWEENN